MLTHINILWFLLLLSSSMAVVALIWSRTPQTKFHAWIILTLTLAAMYLGEVVAWYGERILTALERTP